MKIDRVDHLVLTVRDIEATTTVEQKRSMLELVSLVPLTFL